MGFRTAIATLAAVRAFPKALFTLLLLAGSFAVLATVTKAETSAYCGRQGAAEWDSIKQDMVGTWSITHLGGYAEASGMILPIPPDTTAESFDMSLIGGDLTGYHPEAPSPLVIQPVDEPRWVATATGDKPAPATTPDEEAIAVAGCDQMELPRVIGTSGGIVAGHQLDFTFRMIVLDAAHMWGVMDVVTVVDGRTVTAHRTVTLARQS